MEQSYGCQAHLFWSRVQSGKRLLISMLYSLEGFQQGKTYTNVRTYGISPLLLRCSFSSRQVLRSERIMVYKLQRFLQYSTLYIPWRNAYLYRGMNHAVYIGHFSTIRINSYIPFWHNRATHACKFCMRIHVAVGMLRLF